MYNTGQKPEKIKIYLAGPLGFSEAGSTFYYEKLVPAISKLGLQYFDPWNTKLYGRIRNTASMKYGIRKKNEWMKLNFEIGKLNRQNIETCDLVIAVLDGSDIDSGTAAEIGYAVAHGKRVIGYRGDIRLSSDNEGCMVNLQVEYLIKYSGGLITGSLDELISYLENLIKNPDSLKQSRSPD